MTIRRVLFAIFVSASAMGPAHGGEGPVREERDEHILYVYWLHPAGGRNDANNKGVGKSGLSRSLEEAVRESLIALGRKIYPNGKQISLPDATNTNPLLIFGYRMTIDGSASCSSHCADWLHKAIGALGDDVSSLLEINGYTSPKVVVFHLSDNREHCLVVGEIPQIADITRFFRELNGEGKSPNCLSALMYGCGSYLQSILVNNVPSNPLYQDSCPVVRKNKFGN